MRIVLAALIVAGVVGGPAYAQVSLDKNRNTNQPININSDTLEVQQDKQLAIFRGKVDAVQGDTRLRYDELYVYYRDRQKDAAAAQKKTASAPTPAAGGPDASSIPRIETKGNEIGRAHV